MKFKDLYQECKTQLTKQVKDIWLEDKDLWKGEGTLKDYDEKLDDFLDKCFTGDNILVEDMGEWESADAFPEELLEKKYWREWISEIKETDATTGEEKIIKLNKEDVSRDNYGELDKDYKGEINLVEKPYKPFKHQVECWEKLLKEKKSICVTTGTGSGKTECFMVPLVKDLADNYAERHSNGQPVAVEPVQAIFLYPLNALMEDQRTRMSEIIECSENDNLHFAVYNGNTPEDDEDEEKNADTVKQDRRKHELVFRNDIRADKHPNILFTNPTMLEYLLLRKEDNPILQHSQKQLRWIVIDETHTFTGAGAAELALLIRRVLDAFDTPIENVRFATSSATVGGTEGEEELKKFISDITGKPKEKQKEKTEGQIEVVKGYRSLQKVDGRDFTELHDDTFLTLNEMVPNGSVEEKLEELDRLCEGENGLRVKLHFFAKALNRGLYVDMRGGDDATFKLMDTIPLDKETGMYDSHVLEANYCSHCGTVFAKAEIEDNKLKRGVISTTSIFDDVDKSTDESDNDNDDDNQANTDNSEIDENKGVFLVTHRKNALNTAEQWNNQESKDVTEELSFNVADNMVVCNDDNGRYVRFENNNCPICGGSKCIRSFNVAASRVARILAPCLLDQAKESDNKDVLYEGKQMIAFADSRKKAAKPTLEQNKDSERKWVEWVVFDKLKAINEDYNKIPQLKEELRAKAMDINNMDTEGILKLTKRIQTAEKRTLSWNEALQALLDSPFCNYFAKQFASNGDLDSDGEAYNDYKKRYVLAALYEVFKYRKRKAKTAETQGLIKVVYGDVEDLRNKPEKEILPQSVVELNNHIHDENLKIHLDDWIDLLTLYLDHKVRTNQNLYFKSDIEGWETIDIEACRNLRTENDKRRTAKKDEKNNRFKELLSGLLGDDYKRLQNNQKQYIDAVVDDCWEKLQNGQVIQRGETFYEDKNCWKDDEIEDEDHPTNEGRMNLTKIYFTLPNKDHLWMCPITNRVLTTTFKGMSPYRDNQNRYGIRAIQIDVDEDFKKRLKVEKPRLFIQSEHTAQLGRSLVKERIKDFKDHKINILSCSTTMEMGVDLGSVELVEMTNIPPHPANYKQRAGRAGRRGQTRSACMTICGSDGVDSRFFADSKENVTKTINPPTVDLKSPQVLQRHINSYLFMHWCRTLTCNTEVCNTLNLGLEVIDLFTDYHWRKDDSKIPPRPDKNCVLFGQNIVRPGGGEDSIPYEREHTETSKWSDFVSWLKGLKLSGDDSNIKEGIAKIIKDSIFTEDNIPKYLMNTAIAMENVWSDLNSYFETLNARKRNYDFTSRLRDNLLSYLSTHQFLPNANMPVNIVELEIDNRRNKENTTYDLATALGQWAPGNYITIKDTTYQIGGVRWDRAFDTIKKCDNCGHTWISKEEECPRCHSEKVHYWEKFGRKQLQLLKPIAFVPTTDRSRITNNSQNYTMMKAELIGASEQVKRSKGWFAPRISDSENKASHILMYNDGKGFGYRICRQCGMAQLEESAADNSDLSIVDVFYNKNKKVEKDDKREYKYHDNLGKRCKFDNKDNLADKVFRNIIIGGLIQTDYCEISFYREDGLVLKPFGTDEDKKILYTLGILICSYMVDEGICDRGDIDFVLIGNRALCIYDKAKGGAGYSKQLGYYNDNRKQPMIADALDYCRNKLDKYRLFQLLDTYSQRYADQIDINATKKWLKDEKDHRGVVPKKIAHDYPGTQNASFFDIEQSIRRSENE